MQIPILHELIHQNGGADTIAHQFNYILMPAPVKQRLVPA